jgi:DNA-binding PadR family transcriptional regulator
MTHLDALKMLDDCPEGATHDNLLSHGITAKTLADLVGDGLLRDHIVTMANPKGMRVTWYRITEKGRAALT